MPQTMPDLLCRMPTPTVAAAVASLQVLGVDPERIDTIPVSPLEAFRGEVVGQIPSPGTPLDPHTEVVLFVSRDGLAERLPHGFLEPLPTTQDHANVSIEPGQSLDFYERQVGAYGPGRRFVTVIDRALGRLDRDLERVLDGLSVVGNDATFARRSLGFLELADLPLEDREAVFLAAELQRLHRWVGPRAGMQTVLSQFLGLPLEVTETAGPVMSIPPALRAPLGAGKARLGEGVLLGPQFEDPATTLLLRIGPLPLAQFVAYDRDPQWQRKVLALLSVVAPAGHAHALELVLDPADRRAVLGDNWSGRLGRTTHLPA